MRESRRTVVAQAAAAKTGAVVSEPAPSVSGFRISDVVTHPKFGTGTIERAEKDLVTVLFPNVGYKTLLASAVTHATAAKIA